MRPCKATRGRCRARCPEKHYVVDQELTLYAFGDILKKPPKYETADHTTNEKDITVVICNYARPGNIVEIIKEISKNPYIGEIIVTHGKPETYREFEGAKNIQNYEINSKYGGAQRFFEPIVLGEPMTTHSVMP